MPDAGYNQARHSIDFHSHLLPGVDDGIATLAEAKSAIAGLAAAGFFGAVITPHIYQGVFDNTATSLRASFAAFQANLHDAGQEFSLYLAAEYFADAHSLRLISNDDVISLPVGDERWVLLELPYFQETPFAAICLSALVARGYRPVIAHVERYRYVAQSPTVFLEYFARFDAVLQGDIGSLAGQHGVEVRQFSLWLAERNLVQLWGTDLHRATQVERYIVPGLTYLSSTRPLNAPLAHLAQGYDGRN